MVYVGAAASFERGHSPCTPRVGSEGEKENQKPRMPKDEARPGSDGFFMFFLIDVQLCNLHGIIDPTD